MKVLVCGSRTWTDDIAIRLRLTNLPRGTTVLHGNARGADTIAATVAASLGLQVLSYPAQWDRHGRSAGYRRNVRMLNEKPDLVIAFQRDGSTGTQHVIDMARARGIPTEVYTA